MGQGAWSGGDPPVAADHRALQVDAQIGAVGGGDAHGAGGPQAFDMVFDTRLDVGVGQQTAQGLGVLVADVDDSRAAFQNGGQLRRVHQTLDGAIDHQGGLRQGLHHRGQALQGVAGPRGSDHGQTRRGSRGGELDDEHPGLQACRGQSGQLDQDRPALGLGQDGHAVTGDDATLAQHGLEGVEPGGLYSFLQHEEGILWVIMTRVHDHERTKNAP